MSETSIKVIVSSVYDARKNRRVHPEGEFDAKSRFYPSARENADNFTSTIRSPSAAWPYSYMVAARTRKHCRALVLAALSGAEVPADVIAAIHAAIPADLAEKVSAMQVA